MIAAVAFPFLIGAGFQPIANLDAWVSRGSTCMYGLRQDIDTIDAWTAACLSRDLKMIRPARSNPALDTEPSLVAWELGDEPDVSGVSPAALIATAQGLRAVNPERPILVNFADPLVLGLVGYPSVPQATYLEYLQAVDWVSGDIYPVATVLPPNAGDLSLVAQGIDRRSGWDSGSRPQFAWIETSNQGLGNNIGPTKEQVRNEMWRAILHGARGLFFYPKHWSSGVVTNHDATPPDIATEITTQNQTIRALSSVLQGAVNPSEISASAPLPLEVGWRSTESDHYIIVINNSGVAQTLQPIMVSGMSVDVAYVYGESRTVGLIGSQLIDDFAPFGVHIYVCSAVAPSSPREVRILQSSFSGG